jgi:PmbA protein
MELEKIRKEVGKRFDAYEIFYLKETTRKVETRDCEISGFEIREEEGIALRAMRGKKMSFSYTFALDSESINDFLRKTEELFPFLDEDDAYGFIDKKNLDEYPSIPLYDEKGQSVSAEEKIAYLIKMEEAIRKDRRIVATRHCELTESLVFVSLLNSNGLEVQAKRTLYVLSALAVAKGKEEVSWYDYTWSHDLQGIDFVKFGELLREKALSFLSPISLETGIYDGILSPRVAADLLSVLSSSFLGENLYKGKTRLKGKTGLKCFSDLINIRSTGIRGPLSFPFDGEGFPSCETEVVTKGYFNGFLYDSYYGRKLNAKSTGNCARDGITDPPRCGIRGIYVDEGKECLPELDEGEIIVEDLIGVHTANPVTGDFSLGAQGFVKRKGELRPVLGVVLSGNVFEVFENVKAVGSDLRFYGKYGSPSLFVSTLRMSGT